MQILITGGFGFVGGRLAEYFSQSGHQVVIGSRKEIKSSLLFKDLKSVKVAWENKLALELICQDIDLIIHAAGMNSQESIDNPEAALTFNGLATGRLVDAAAKAGVKKFIYISTAHVYGNKLTGDISEDTRPSNLHPYATSHLSGESYVMTTNQSGSMQGIVIRLSNAFGAPIHKDVNCWMLLANDLCRQAVVTQRIVLKTDGLQYRNFVEMTEVCRLIQLLSVKEFSSKDPKIFNIGSTISQSVLEMTELIQKRCLKVLGFEPEINRKEGEVGELNYPFSYLMTNLNKLGIYPRSTEKIVEIDNLLLFCNSAFAR